MEAHKLRKQLALDTNVLLDLAEGADFAHDFKETFQGKGYVLRLPPMVVAELHEQSVSTCSTWTRMPWCWRSMKPICHPRAQRIRNGS